MRANNLSISIPYKGCDKNCPYCVSKMTGYMKTDEELFFKNLKKARNRAEFAQIGSVSITGKGEPVMNMDAIKFVVNEFCDYPVELQTGGLLLNNNLGWVNRLAIAGVDIFAISMDSITDFHNLHYVIKRINSINRTARVTMNVSDMLIDPSEFGFINYIDKCIAYGVHQFSFRNLSIPTGTAKDNKTAKWIAKHVLSNDYYKTLIGQFEKEQHDHNSYAFIRGLNYGAYLYDVKGVSFTFFDYCVQDFSHSEDIRSLIYQEDGHLYTSWVSKASRIF